MIKGVYVFPNRVVLVYDENGEQIPEYQGRFEEVRQKILDNAEPETRLWGWPNFQNSCQFQYLPQTAPRGEDAFHVRWLLDKERQPYPVDYMDAVEWARKMNDQRIIEHTLFSPEDPENQEAAILVSTCFLGINHGMREGAPVLFETMIFGGKYDEYQERHVTFEEAKARHKEIVERMKHGESPE